MATCSKSCTQNAIPLLGETLELPTAHRTICSVTPASASALQRFTKLLMARTLVGDRVDLQDEKHVESQILVAGNRNLCSRARLVAAVRLWARRNTLASLTTSAVAANEPSPVEQTVGYSYDAVQVAGYGQGPPACPDVATLSLGVEVIDDTVAEARRRAAESLQEVKEALTEKG